MKYRLTHHFKQRVINRTPYDDIESFKMDVKNKLGCVVEVTNTTNKKMYRRLDYKFRTHPDSVYWVIDWMRIAIVVSSDRKTWITLINL